MDPKNDDSKEKFQKEAQEEQRLQKKQYKVTAHFADLDIKKFLALSSAVYVIENVFYYPFDVVRTKLQVERQGNFHIGKSIELAKKLGRKGLYAGFTSYSIGSLPATAVYFLTYNYAKDYLQAIHEKHTKDRLHEGRQALWVSFAAGAFADVVSNGFLVPLEVIVQRLQLQDINSKVSKEMKYEGGIDAIRKIYKMEGIRGFYRGFGASLLAYAPASAVWWTVYERSKAVFSEYLFYNPKTRSAQVTGSVSVSGSGSGSGSGYEWDNNNNNKIETVDTLIVEQHTLAQVLAGAVAGWVTTFITNPMDVIKTRLQTQHYQQNLDKSQVPTIYSNSLSAMKHMIKEEGIRSFTKGIGPRLATTTLFSSWLDSFMN